MDEEIGMMNNVGLFALIKFNGNGNGNGIGIGIGIGRLYSI